MSKASIVARRRGCQLATNAPVLTARGKPSTWFPRGRLVEQSRQDKTQKRRQKARTEKENPPATAAAHKKSPPRPRLFRGELLFAAHCWYLWPALPVPLPLPFCPPHSVLVTMSNSSRCQFCRRRSIYEIFTFETDQNVSFIAKYVVENCNNVLQA